MASNPAFTLSTKSTEYLSPATCTIPGNLEYKFGYSSYIY